MTTLYQPACAAPPSRGSNPFATCWTKPGALGYGWQGACAEGASIGGLIERWSNAGWRGQIVGPHGSGKTTLLHALHRAFSRSDTEVVWLDLTGEAVRLRSDASYLVEGFERLRRGERVRLLRQLSNRSAGYLVATHHAWSVWPMSRSKHLCDCGTDEPTD